MVGFSWATDDIDGGDDKTAAKNESRAWGFSCNEEACLDGARERNEESVACEEGHWVGVGEAIPNAEGDCGYRCKC